MPTHEIEEFAELPIQFVPDIDIQFADVRLSGGRTPEAMRWQEAARNLAPEEFAKVIIPDIVDDTIFYLLHAIDEEAFHLSFTASNSKTVDLCK